MFWISRRKKKEKLEKALMANRLMNRPSFPYLLRKCDPKGCGHFGASRGSGKHKGLDIKLAKGQEVFSPIDGIVKRLAFPYGDDYSWKGVLLLGTGHFKGVSVKIFYLEPSVSKGQTIRKGDPIGKAQDIGERYPGATPHIHLELRLAGILVDPEPYFG